MGMAFQTGKRYIFIFVNEVGHATLRFKFFVDMGP